MPKPITNLVNLVLLGAALLLSLGCTQGPAQRDASLPPGFTEARIPNAGLNAYLYASQGSPIRLPVKWFGGGDPQAIAALAALGDTVDVQSIGLGVGTTLDHFGGQIAFTSEDEAETAVQLASSRPAKLEVWRSGADVGIVSGSGDWPASVKASLQAGDSVLFSEAYPAAWELLRMLPASPPDAPVAAGFAKVEGGLLDSVSGRMGLGLTGVTQALGGLQVTDMAFIAYAGQPLGDIETLSADYLRQQDASFIVAMRSGYPGFLLSFFLSSFATQAGLEKGATASGQEVFTGEVDGNYLVVKSIGNVIFIAAATDRAKAEALVDAVLAQQ
ncbi:MAG: hypothetical protein HY532_06995 [Chloroflexi bacterium]|nr:hypothetical protein [Chloroflexota bacterium]